jgi:hypothetical protein
MATLPAVLTWTQLLNALRSCTGDHVLIRDGRETKHADSVRNRPAASGTEFCLFSTDTPTPRLTLISRLETLAKGTGRRFMSSAKANVNGANLLIDGVEDEAIDGVTLAVVTTRRPKLGYNRSESSAAPTSLGRSSKRIKTT